MAKKQTNKPTRTFTLVRKSSVAVKLNRGGNKSEEVFHYSDGTETIAFRADPNKSFAYVLVEGDRNLLYPILDKFIDQGFDQHKYAGGFDEAVKTLVI